MTGNSTGRTEYSRERRTDSAFGAAVVPPHRPRPLTALGVTESLVASGEALALGGVEWGVLGREQRPAAEARTTATAATGIDPGEGAGSGHTSQFIVGEGGSR